MNRRTLLTSITALAGSLGCFHPALAQFGASRPIRMLVPLPPGGAPDAYARLIADHMGRTLGHAIVVEHRPGANGNVGSQYAAHQPADGNLILLTTMAMTEISPSAFADPKWTLDEFIPLIRGVEAPLVLVANPTVPANSLDELVAWIRKNPGKLNYSSYDAGTPSHFLGFQLNEEFGLDLVHVPAGGSGHQATDLMAGHVLFGFAQVQATLPLIRQGKLKAIAITSPAREPYLPNVPTFAEIGHPEFTASVWFGFMLRAGTPSDTVTALLNAAKAAHADPEVKAKLETLGFDVSGETGAQFAADIRAQVARWAKLVKAAGFKSNDE
jgi:tripartite-type tricarboxylate transporter receptor subunit TctC